MMETDLIKELFDYKDGQLYWRKKVNKKHSIDKPAGTVNSNGYCVITINSKKYFAHRLIWLWHGLELPPMIDHINRNTLDNRIENLRPSDYVTNAYNSKRKADNTSGHKNVSWCNTYDKWVVQIYENKKKHSARFDSLESAVNYANAIRKKLHGEFACEGGE